jgi:hypothetical protein
VNDIETATRSHGGADCRDIGVKPISQCGPERLNVVGQHGGHEVNAARGTGFAIERAGHRTAEKVADARTFQSSDHQAGHLKNLRGGGDHSANQADSGGGP